MCTGTGYSGVGNWYAIRELHLNVRRPGLSGSPSGGCHYKGGTATVKGRCKVFEDFVGGPVIQINAIKQTFYCKMVQSVRESARQLCIIICPYNK